MNSTHPCDTATQGRPLLEEVEDGRRDLPSPVTQTSDVRRVEATAGKNKGGSHLFFVNFRTRLPSMGVGPVTVFFRNTKYAKESRDGD